MLPDLPFPRWLLRIGLLVTVVALVPVACIARFREIPSRVPRIHLIQDMDNQGRYKAQQPSDVYVDGRASRKPVPGTVAWTPRRAPGTETPEERAQVALKRSMKIGANEAMYRGLNESGYVNEFPMPLNEQMLDRGQRQFGIYCAPCHGLSGYGDGMISRRAIDLQQGSWVPPASLHEDPYNNRELGHYFNTITNGIRNMPAYRSAISVEDRWAIVAYIKALQLSQNASVDMVPAAERRSIQPATP